MNEWLNVRNKKEENKKEWKKELVNESIKQV